MSVNTNVSALMAQRQLSNATQQLNQSLERLASGKRINSAKDDAAGLQISNRLTAQIRGIDVGVRNANDGISIMQTAEGAMQESTQLLQRMRDLSLQSANGANSQAERQALDEEFGALNDELNRIAEATSFAGRKLLNGTFGRSAFQIGPSGGEAVQIELNSMRSDDSRMGGVSVTAAAMASKNWHVTSPRNTLTIEYTNKQGHLDALTIEAKAGDDIEELATYINGQTDDFSASVNEHGQLQLYLGQDDLHGATLPRFSGALADELGLSQGKVTQHTVNSVSIGSVGQAQNAVAVLDTALAYVDSERAMLGAYQNRFAHAVNNLDNVQQNLAASNSRILDTDYAKETTQLVKQQILQQVSTTILAQAKQSPNLVLSLLG
nr:flagellin [Vibrio agarilyticus]